MVAVRRPSSLTACATPATSGRRAGAPGRVSTARSSQITTVSSMKTESGQSSAAGACSTAQPLAPRASTYAACCAWASDTSTEVRVMCVTIPSASLLLGWRTKPVPFTVLSCHHAGPVGPARAIRAAVWPFSPPPRSPAWPTSPTSSTRLPSRCRVSRGHGRGQRAELPENGDVVANGQVLSDEAGLVEGHDVDVTCGGGTVRCGYAVKWSVVGARHHANADDLVAFGHHLLQVEMHIGASGPQAAEDLPGAFRAGRGAGARVAVDESGRDEAADRAEIVLVEHLGPERLGAGLDVRHGASWRVHWRMKRRVLPVSGCRAMPATPCTRTHGSSRPAARRLCSSADVSAAWSSVPSATTATSMPRSVWRTWYSTAFGVLTITVRIMSGSMVTAPYRNASSARPSTVACRYGSPAAGWRMKRSLSS